MGKMHAEGVTLIELMVVLGVLAIVLSVGVPAFNQLIATNRMTAAVNDVVGALQIARSEAIKRRGTVTVCASTNSLDDNPACAPAGGLTQGWLVFTDNNDNAVVDAGETIIAVGPAAHTDIDDNSSFDNGGAGDPCYAAFGATGQVANLPGAPSASLANLQYCDLRGDDDTGGGIAAGRWIRLSATGRPQLVRERTRLQGGDNPLGGC